MTPGLKILIRAYCHTAGVSSYIHDATCHLIREQCGDRASIDFDVHCEIVDDQRVRLPEHIVACDMIQRLEHERLIPKPFEPPVDRIVANIAAISDAEVDNRQRRTDRESVLSRLNEQMNQFSCQ